MPPPNSPRHLTSATNDFSIIASTSSSSSFSVLRYDSQSSPLEITIPPAQEFPCITRAEKNFTRQNKWDLPLALHSTPALAKKKKKSLAAMASVALSATSQANLLDNHPSCGPRKMPPSVCAETNSGGAEWTVSASLTRSASSVPHGKPHLEEQFYRFNPYCSTPRMILDPNAMFARMVVASLQSSRAAMVLLTYDADRVSSPHELYCMRHCSYSSVRLQFLIRQRFPNTYDTVVTGKFSGKWHLFLRTIPGLTTFTYTTKEVESTPDMQWLMASDEMRVSDRDKASSMDPDATVSAWIYREILCNDLIKFIAEALDFVVTNTKWNFYSQIQPTFWRANGESRPPSAVDSEVLVRVPARQLFHDPSWLWDEDTVPEDRFPLRRHNAGMVELVFQTIDPATSLRDISGEVLRLSTEFLSDRFEKRFPVISGTLSRIQLRRYTRQCVLQVVLGKDRAPPMHPANLGKDPYAATRELGKPKGCSLQRVPGGTQRKSGGDRLLPRTASAENLPSPRGEGNTVAAVVEHAIGISTVVDDSSTVTVHDEPPQNSSLGHTVSLLSFASNVFSKRSGVLRGESSPSSSALSSSTALLGSHSLTSLPGGGGAPSSGLLQPASDQSIIPQLSAMG